MSPTPEIREAARQYQERCHARAVDHAQQAAAMLNPEADPGSPATGTPGVPSAEAAAAAQVHATLAVFWQREAHA